MNATIIVKREATGTHNGKEFKGIVIAVLGKKKGIARAYLPDVFDEFCGTCLAVNKLRCKVQKEKIVGLCRGQRELVDWAAKYMGDATGLEFKIRKEEKKLKAMQDMYANRLPGES